MVRKRHDIICKDVALWSLGTKQLAALTQLILDCEINVYYYIRVMILLAESLTDKDDAGV